MIKSFKDILIKNNVLFSEDVLGISEKEITIIEDEFNLMLPKSYKKFLSIFGRNSGELFESDDIHYPDLLSFRSDFFEFLEEEEIDFNLQENAYIFQVYQDHTFLYFICDGNEDPVVYSFNGEVKLEHASFTKYFKMSVLEFFFFKHLNI